MKGFAPCPGCDGWKDSHKRIKLCLACRLKENQKTWPRCIDCRTRLDKRSRTRCRACHLKALRSRSGVVNGSLRSFSGRLFGAYLAQPDVEWSVPDLARAAGIHHSTIYTWLNETRKPLLHELTQVARVLGLPICAACHGQVMTYPDEAAVQRLIERFCQMPGQPTVLPVARSRPTPERIIRGTFVLNPGLRQLMIGETVVNLSRMECALLVHLAQHTERYTRTAELAEAVRRPTQVQPPSDHAVRQSLARLLRKLAGAGIAQLIESRQGAGYRLEVPA